jgi:pre-mRNA-processing factor 40
MPMQEKKQIFSDYLHIVRDEERQQLQLKKQRQRQLFFALIDECRDLGILKLNSSSKYYIVSKKLALRDYKKFMAVDERDRDEIFQDYIDELFKQEREEAQEKT